jgi:hypothetical protein
MYEAFSPAPPFDYCTGPDVVKLKHLATAAIPHGLPWLEILEYFEYALDYVALLLCFIFIICFKHIELFRGSDLNTGDFQNCDRQ